MEFITVHQQIVINTFQIIGFPNIGNNENDQVEVVNTYQIKGLPNVV